MPQETKEVLLRKIERIKTLLNDLERLLNSSFASFKQDQVPLLAAQRNFELMVELASDINTSLILDKTGQTPDSYREAFSGLGSLGFFADEVLKELVDSAKLRNILVHEYDFEEDYEKFYNSAKNMLPAYRVYLKAVFDYLQDGQKR